VALCNSDALENKTEDVDLGSTFMEAGEGDIPRKRIMERYHDSSI
jgi:hypothetical protein